MTGVVAVIADEPTVGYFVPGLYALFVHLALLMVLIGLPQRPAEKVVVQPKSIQAKLVQLPAKETPRPKARPKAKTPPKQESPVVAKKVEPAAPTAAPSVAPTIKDKPAENRIVEENVDPGIDPSLDDWLAEESSILQADEELALVDSYAARIENQVYRQWSRPASARRDMELTLLIRLLPRGDIVSVTVLKSSGNEALDRSAVAAVSRVEQLAVVREMENAIFERYFREFEMLFKPDDLRL